MKGKNLQDYFVQQMQNSEDFVLIVSSNKSQKESIQLQLKSDRIRTKLGLHKNTKNLFSFIINDSNLLFYFRVKHNELLTPEIKNRFSSQFEGLNSSDEFKLRLYSEEDVRDIIQYLFVNKLNCKINLVEISKNANKPKEISEPKLDLYNPQGITYDENLTEEKNDFDYIENHRKLIEIGDLAEKIVLENEIDFLQTNFPELAKKVRSVSNNPKLGFDILSFETNGKQKQIEVKAISKYNENKSFIITRNELSKSKTYSNYYVHCVTEINSERPRILRLKNPNFENNNEFIVEPLAFKVTFQ